MSKRKAAETTAVAADSGSLSGGERTALRWFAHRLVVGGAPCAPHAGADPADVASLLARGLLAPGIAADGEEPVYRITPAGIAALSAAPGPLG